MSGLKYISDGAWLPGVPARDLSAEEAKQYADLIEAAAAAGHILYIVEDTQATTVTVQVTATTDEAPLEKKGR